MAPSLTSISAKSGFASDLRRALTAMEPQQQRLRCAHRRARLLTPAAHLRCSLWQPRRAGFTSSARAAAAAPCLERGGRHGWIPVGISAISGACLSPSRPLEVASLSARQSAFLPQVPVRNWD